MPRSAWSFSFSRTAWQLGGLLAIAASAAHAEPLELSRQLVLSDPPALMQASQWNHLPTLRLGHAGTAVAELTALIRQSGLLPDLVIEDEARFDRQLESAIKSLQKNFGLKPDGIAGAQLYANLEATLAAKRAAVEAFAIRLEYLAHEARLEGRKKMVVINVPSFTLRAIDLETGRTIIESPVIVGRKDRQTPIGRLNIVSLTANPEWKPPPVVLKNDILPRLGKASKWWEKSSLTGVGPNGNTKPGNEVTAAEIAAGWQFVQASGTTNALGLIKFETDSPDAIYLHDTNDRLMFSSANRTHSSGCVRVKEWQSLAAFIAESSAEKVRELIDKKMTRRERIPEKVPVYIEYFQGDVVDGKAVYFPDIYARNRPTETARTSPRLPNTPRGMGG